MYNVIPLLLIPIPVAYTVGSGASFTLNANMGISQASNHRVSSFFVDEKASFRYVQASNNGSTATLYIDGALTVNKGASFYMQAYNNSAPLVWYTANQARRLTVDNPKSFVLYSRNAPALNFTSSTGFLLNGGQLNYWSAAKTPLEEAGTFDDIPQSKWFKKDYATPLELSGTVSSGGMIIASSNLTQEDQPYPPLSNLLLYTARVLSVGDLPLAVNPIVDDHTPISGMTASRAKVLVEYDTIEEPIGTADDPGKFSVSTQNAIPAGTAVTVSANVPFLIRQLITTSQVAGELFIEEAPVFIRFILPPVSRNPLLLRREAPVPAVKVIDTRVYSTQWELAASINAPIQTQSGHILPNAVVFVDDGNMVPLRIDDPIPVFVGGPDEEETNVTWNEDKGILLNVTVPLHNREEYTTRLTWEVHPL